jgi:hypothetical protein
MYNNLCNKQDGFFFSMSYLHTGQKSPNEFLKTYKPFDMNRLYLFYCSIFKIAKHVIIPIKNLVIIDFITRHAKSYYSLFIHIIFTIL